MEITDPLHAYIPFQLAVNSSQAQNDISKLRIYFEKTNETEKKYNRISQAIIIVNLFKNSRWHLI